LVSSTIFHIRRTSRGSAMIHPARSPASPYTFVRLLVATKVPPRWKLVRGAGSKRASR
jgi:hypothetical protein